MYQYQPYQQYYQPQYQNQYQNQYAQQQYVQAGLAGKIVDTFDNITANDVPMDGRYAVFVKKDGSELQTRAWTPNGTIATVTYKPYTETLADTPNKISSDEINCLRNDFNALNEVINERFDRMEKAISGRNGRNKKEVSDEEQN